MMCAFIKIKEVVFHSRYANQQKMEWFWQKEWIIQVKNVLNNYYVLEFLRTYVAIFFFVCFSAQMKTANRVNFTILE